MLHSAIYIPVLLHASEWPLVWFAIVGTAEFFPICLVLHGVGRHSLLIKVNADEKPGSQP